MNTNTTPRLNRLRVARGGVGLGAAALLASAGVAVAAPASAPISNARTTKGATMQVSSPRPTAGATVTVSGDAPLDARAGSTITLESPAFASRLRADHMPAVRAQVTAQGTYKVAARIQRSARPNTTYTIAGSFRGAQFPTVSPITVRSSQTGASIQVPKGKVDPGTMVAIAGDAPLDAHAGQWITLTSPAFASALKVGGVPAVRTQITAQGTYTATAMIKSNIVGYNAATVSASINGRWFPRIETMKLNAGLNGTVHVIYHNARGTAAPGTKVILVGDAPSSAPGGLRSGDMLTFTSKAFADGGTASAMISAQGTYQLSATIAKGTKPGSYAVSGSYQGMPFKTGDTVKVVR